VLKNIRGGSYALPLMRVLPLNFRLRIGQWLARRPFMLYLTPVCMASFSIKKKFGEWKTIHQLSTIIVAPSNAIAESMIQNDAPKNKIKIIPHGIPLPEQKEIKHQNIDKTNKKDPIRFFFLGRICHVKGLHILLKAFTNIRGKVELHIIGGSGNKGEQRYNQQLKKQYKPDQRIFWHGKIKPNKVNQMISKFDIMVHPTIFMEIFGLNIAEALSMDKPVIATRCGGAEMQIKDGVNGWLVEPNDLPSLIDTINTAAHYFLSEKKEFKEINSTVNSIKQHVVDIINLYNTAIK